MNTPAHIIFSLALLGRENAWRYAIAIAIGAVLPDVGMLIFYGWQKLQGIEESIIWSDIYFRPHWQNFFDLTNSIPLILIAIIIAAWQQRKFFTLLFASMLLHCLLDLPVHHDDAHRHFFPFSDWRFASPFSYWDREHYGNVIGNLEIAAFFVCLIWLWLYDPFSKHRNTSDSHTQSMWHLSKLRWILIASLVIYTLYFWYVLTTWL